MTTPWRQAVLTLIALAAGVPAFATDQLALSARILSALPVPDTEWAFQATTIGAGCDRRGQSVVQGLIATILEPRKAIVLHTYLGEFTGPGALKALFASSRRFNNELPAPDPGSKLGRLRSISGLFNRGTVLDQIKGLVAPPTNFPLAMTVSHAGGSFDRYYYADLTFSFDIAGSLPLPLIAAIRLRNDNPVSPAIFSFTIYFTGRAAS